MMVISNGIDSVVEALVYPMGLRVLTSHIIENYKGPSRTYKRAEVFSPFNTANT